MANIWLITRILTFNQCFLFSLPDVLDTLLDVLDTLLNVLDTLLDLLDTLLDVVEINYIQIHFDRPVRGVARCTRALWQKRT